MSDSPPLKQDWSVVIVILIGTFMAVLNSSIVNVALPKIMNIFNTTPSTIQWVLSIYMMTMGVVMPVTGYLADTFGYKRMYIMAMSIFVAGSCLCGLSWNVSSLIAARVIQAIGGSIMQPLGMAFIYRVTPREKIGMTMGIWGIAAMAAPAIGPTLGGYLVEYVGWRLIFYINVPIGLLNIWLAGIRLTETEKIKGEVIDIFGFVTATAGLFCLLFALSQGSKHGWTSVFIVSFFAASVIMLTAFVINELTHPEPLLELRLFKNWLFTISTIIGSFINIGMFAGMFLLPIFLQNVLGLTAMKSGLLLFPAAIATAIFMPLSGRIFDKYGARAIVLGGMLIVTFTTVMVGRFNMETAFSVMVFWMIIRGIGMGLSMMPITTLGMATIPIALTSKASATSNVVRQVAASLGIAMFTAIMQNRQVFHYASYIQNLNLKATDALSLQQSLGKIGLSQGWDASTIGGVDLALIASRAGKLSMVNAINDCFLIAAVFCFIAVLFSLFIPRGKIVSRPPMSEANASQKAA